LNNNIKLKQLGGIALYTICIALVLTYTAVGQTAVEAKEQTDTTVYLKPEILVTAVRAEQNLLEIPLAITLVPPMVLQTQRGFGIDGILTLVPGVVAQSRTGGIDARIQIRGFGSRGAGQRSNAGTSRGIRFYTDGIPETEPDGRTSFDLINTVHASSVEVVRSNASALWGNASGGIVSVSTVPQQRSAFADVRASLGSFGFMRQSLLANTPMGEGQAYVSITNTSMDGWRQNSAGYQTLGTIGLITKPSDKTNVNVYITGASNQFQIPGPLTLDQFLANPQQAQSDTNIYRPSYVQRNERRDNALVRIGATVDHTFSPEHGISAISFVQSKKLQRSERNTWRDFNRYHVGGNMIYRNTQIVGDNMQNRLLVGGDIQYQDGAILFYSLDANTQGRGTTLRQNKREGALNTGAFLQDEFIAGKLSATIGIRFDAITYANEDYITPTADTTAIYSRFVPKFGVSYQMAPLANLYANIGGGVEVPAGNETDPPAVIGSTVPTTSINTLLKPIVSTTYEVGIKGVMNDASDLFTAFQYDAAVFLIGVQNDVVPYNGGSFYTTAGESRRMGLEIGGMATIRGGITVATSFTVMKTEYISYVIDSGFISPSLAGRSASYAGNQQSGIPSVSATVRIRYDVAAFPGLYAEIESRYMSSYFADDANTISVDGWAVFAFAVGARINIVDQHLALDLLARADNLFGNTYMASAWVNPDVTAGGTPFVESGLPRNFLGSVGIRYTP